MDLLTSWDGEPVDMDQPCRVEFELDGVRNERDGLDVAAVPFERCSPVRSFPSWPHKRHYSGHQWMQRLGMHVPFESLTERSSLLELDRLSTVLGVASQPMWITWPRTGQRHAPDFFARLVNGTGLVIDVRPTERIDDRAREQFDRTARFCSSVGLRYGVYSPTTPTRDANLRFLMRYRDPRWLDPRSAQLLPLGDHRLSDCVEMLGALELPLAACYALLWTGDLSMDLDQPLTMKTPVTWRGVT